MNSLFCCKYPSRENSQKTEFIYLYGNMDARSESAPENHQKSVLPGEVVI